MNGRQFHTSLAAFGLLPTAWREARAAGGVAALVGNTLEGRPYDLRADAGKVVLVFFWRGDSAQRDSFAAIAHAPTSFVLDRQHRVVRETGGRIPARLWDDIAELVFT